MTESEEHSGALVSVSPSPLQPVFHRGGTDRAPFPRRRWYELAGLEGVGVKIQSAGMDSIRSCKVSGTAKAQETRV